jgi:hypothetical protein
MGAIPHAFRRMDRKDLIYWIGVIPVVVWTSQVKAGWSVVLRCMGKLSIVSSSGCNSLWRLICSTAQRPDRTGTSRPRGAPPPPAENVPAITPAIMNQMDYPTPGRSGSVASRHNLSEGIVRTGTRSVDRLRKARHSIRLKIIADGASAARTPIKKCRIRSPSCPSKTTLE